MLEVQATKQDKGKQIVTPQEDPAQLTKSEHRVQQKQRSQSSGEASCSGTGSSAQERAITAEREAADMVIDPQQHANGQSDVQMLCCEDQVLGVKRDRSQRSPASQHTPQRERGEQAIVPQVQTDITPKHREKKYRPGIIQKWVAKQKSPQVTEEKGPAQDTASQEQKVQEAEKVDRT